MTDFGMLAVIIVSGFVLQIAGLVILGLQLREARRETVESQRLTQAVAGLVVQETAKLAARLM
jgi:hypothetical protein